jgi:endonuclease VIII
MPEGDTLFRVAAALSPRLCGETIASFDLFRSDQVTSSLVGQQVRTVDAYGKHLLVGLGPRALLHLHFRMSGVVHIYRPGQALRRSRSTATFALATAQACVWGFRIPVARLHFGSRAREEILHGLGSDILSPQWDVDAALAVFQSAPDLAIGEAVLDQSRVAGIGNVYKSEALHLARMNPFAPVSAFSSLALRELLALACALMRANLPHSGQADARQTGHHAPHVLYQRVTRAGCEVGKGPVHVYGRKGRPCYACGDAVAMMRQGEMNRSTYFCPTCQRSPATLLDR